MAESFQERTEQATPRRRSDARKKGTVAKSVELTNSVVLVAMLATLPLVAGQLGQAFMLSLTKGLSDMPLSLNPADMTRHTWSVMEGPIWAFAPLVAVALAVGVAMNFAQVGFVLSTETLTPTFNKINPANGLKRLLSAHAGMEGLKAVAKTALFGWIAYQAVAADWGRLANLSWQSPLASAAVVGQILSTVFLRVAIAWLLLAALDYFFQRKQVEKQLRMTKEEVKQEYKQNEQSPELKGAMAQRRRRILKGRVAEAVRNADVIITNPTHYSVALKYDRDTMGAPQVVAKGVDHLALRIREMAKEARVPIVPNPPLARQIYKKCEVGDPVPRELFQAVAEVLAYVYATLKRVKA